MRIAITGSTGFLGSALSAHLERDGHEVVRLVRPATGARGVAWDPEAGTIDAPALEGIDAAVHLAGAGVGDRRWTRARKQVLRASRIDAGLLLSRTLAGLSRPPGVLISGSATGYYGHRDTQILDESSGPGRGFLADLCRDWERATEPAAAAGIRVVTIRTGIVLGRGGALFAKLEPIFRLGLGGRLGDGTQYQSWISLDDHVAAVRWLLRNDVQGPVNLTAPEPVTNAELTRALGAALRRPTFMAVPRIAIAALLGRELAEYLLGSQRVLPRRLLAGGFTFAHARVEEALGAIVA